MRCPDVEAAAACEAGSVQRSRALQLMTERPEGCEAEDAVQEVPAELPRKGERKPIKLLLSAFEGRAPVLLFDYHPAVGKEREMDPDRVVATYEPDFRRFLPRSDTRDRTSGKRGVTGVSENHFPASWHLGRKDLPEPKYLGAMAEHPGDAAALLCAVGTPEPTEIV
ncbi:unnamed protein product [Effrenium voratum]|nr:unnamed protein product [Effrenium voratum]